MRKKLFVALWLLVPVVLLAIHYGPGQDGLARDQASTKLALARSAEAKGAWSQAVELYSEALAALPTSNLLPRYQIRLAQAKARLMSGELPEAKADLDGLLTDMLKNNASVALTREVRSELAAAEYYAGWLMRLEGAATEEWMAETESARQHFRLLSETAKTQNQIALATDSQKNLEAVIRLELMDLSELKALPLPKQCQNCSNCSSKCRKQRESNCKKPGESKDVREKISEQKSKNAGRSGREGTGS